MMTKKQKRIGIKSLTALENTDSIAGLLLTTEALVSDVPAKESAILQCPAEWAVWAE